MENTGNKFSYTEFSDDKLISLVREGSREAIEALLLKYKGCVSYYAGKYFSDSLTFDDWYQEGMIGLLHAVRTYRAEEEVSFSTYASVCIRNRLASCFKKTKNSKNLALNSAVPYEDISDLTVNSLEDDYIANENFRHVEQVFLSQLSQTEQRVMRYYLAGFSYTEIANELSITVKAVDNAVCRAKNKLKKALKS